MSKVKCLHCPIKRLPHQMEEHVLHCKKNKPYECDICGQCFPTAKGLGTHKGNFHTADERGTLFRCPYCPHGSDDKRAFDKHVSRHEESGGSGFRALTRSRSREPARRSSVSNNSAASPFRRSSRARSCNSSAPRQRAPSRNFRETSTTTNSTNSTTINWASMPPTTNNLLGNNTENRREAGSSGQGILPIRMIANGLLEIAVLNPEYAERRIAEYKRQFAATVNQLSAMNRRLREHCIAEGIQLAPEDFVEEKIQALKAKYPQIYGEPSGQQ